MHLGKRSALYRGHSYGRTGHSVKERNKQRKEIITHLLMNEIVWDSAMARVMRETKGMVDRVSIMRDVLHTVQCDYTLL